MDKRFCLSGQTCINYIQAGPLAGQCRGRHVGDVDTNCHSKQALLEELVRIETACADNDGDQIESEVVMAYFSNGSEGDFLNEQCAECLHGMNETMMCPVMQLQMEYNYKQLDKANTDLRAAMNMLVDESGICRMRNAIKQAGVVIDLSERDQLGLL